MLRDFSDNGEVNADIKVAIISFGYGEAKLEVPLTSAGQVEYTPLVANGNTPLGAALKLCKQLVEDREVIPSRSYRPTIILVSDGYPNDQWEGTLEQFIQTGRTAKCERWGLAIGDGCDEQMLRKFIGNDEQLLFKAENVSQIAKFFKTVTMSTIARTQSKTPNATVYPTQEKTQNMFSEVENLELEEEDDF